MKLKALASAMVVMSGMAWAQVGAVDPVNWSQVPATEIAIFYPGVSPMEWITGRRHGGARALTRGDTCADCHADETLEMGEIIALGETLEPEPVAGRAPGIPVKVQATHDGSNLYLRFSWQEPAAHQGAKQDADNQVKLALMLDAGNVDGADQNGCWASCHGDSRTMPEGQDGRTKYVSGGSLAQNVYYDLMQWRSGSGAAYDGYVADERVLAPADGQLTATGKQTDGTWSVVFVRALDAAGPGNLSLKSGEVYNFGFAVHDQYSTGRFHYVSLGYTLGLDADADIVARKM